MANCEYIQRHSILNMAEKYGFLKSLISEIVCLGGIELKYIHIKLRFTH